jgi:hypothetical protein
MCELNIGRLWNILVVFRKHKFLVALSC